MKECGATKGAQPLKEDYEKNPFVVFCVGIPTLISTTIYVKERNGGTLERGLRHLGFAG
jgi:hypothetical protein